MTTVAIIGGGFTGAAVAYHLARLDAGRLTAIVVVEPREALGAGLAYSSEDPSHRINVPAERMSLDTGDPQGFARWLEATGALADDKAAFDREGRAFPRRSLFGRYVADCLAPLLAAGRIVHRRERAQGVRRLKGGGFEIDLAGGPLRADLVVLATTHPPPAVPAPLRALAFDPRFIADPGDARALEGIGQGARVLVVGNGLTAADVVATLDRQGHRGSILMLSRHGLRSRGHAPVTPEPFGDFVSAPARTALELTRRTRRAIVEAERRGGSWHAVFDALRVQAPDVWQALPERERRQVVRRLRSFWDVHRFRIAPQVADVLDRLEADGRLRSVAASLLGARGGADALRVDFRLRATGRVEAAHFGAVVNTTGPAHRDAVARQPGRSLHEAGLVALDGVGLGLATGRDHRALDRAGRPVPGLFIAGPLARGTFGELMGLPQVTAHAEIVAGEIARELHVRASPARHLAIRPARSVADRLDGVRSA